MEEISRHEATKDKLDILEEEKKSHEKLTKEANDTIKQLEKEMAEEIGKTEMRMNETIRKLESSVTELGQTIEKLKKEHEEVTKTKFEVIYSNFSCRFLSSIFPN